VATVVRAVEEVFRERLGGDHLATRGNDQPFQLAQEAARVAVGRNDDELGFELVERLDAAVLADLDARLGRVHGKPAHQTGGLERGVGRVEDRRPEAALEGLVHPLGREAARPQVFVLGGERVAFLVVGGEAEAAGPTERVARQLREAVERQLGLPPQPDGRVAADRLGGDVERSGAAAEREAPVPAARPARDRAGLVQAHLQAGLGEAQRGRAAGHAPADDDRIRRAVETPRGDRRRRFVQPIAGQLSREVARRIGTKARLPTSLVSLTVLYA
jgi:hypothetical protein